jgi:hypothetical protein
MRRTFDQIIADAKAHSFTGSLAEMADAEVARADQDRADARGRKQRTGPAWTPPPGRLGPAATQADAALYRGVRVPSYRRPADWEVRAAQCRRHHGLSLADLDELCGSQAGRCYLCAASFSGSRYIPQVDHDHRCCPEGRSCPVCRRGVTCDRCNVGIAAFGDDPVRLRAAADALEAGGQAPAHFDRDPALLRLVAGNLEKAISLVTVRMSRLDASFFGSQNGSRIRAWRYCPVHER